MTRKIHIYCDGGFGNRFNGLVSGLLFAEVAGFQPLVIWPRNNWCGASYAQLIENKAFVIERELASYVPEKNGFQFFMTEDHLNMGVEFLSPLQISSIDEALAYFSRSEKDVYFHTPLIPNYLENEKLYQRVRDIRFSANLYQRANEFIADTKLIDFLGLQIRKTDFAVNAADDDNLFELVKNCPQKQFFVCSDSKDVEKRFLKLSNVVVYPKRAHVELMVPGDWSTPTVDHSGRVYASNVNRNDLSVEDAVVDLLILARSQIVRTSHSTFLNTALLLKQARAPFVLDQPDQKPPFAIDMQSLDDYFDTHFEYSGRSIQVNVSPEEHLRLFDRLKEQWTDYGINSPYTSVLSDRKFLMDRIEENREEFYASGVLPVSWMKLLAARNQIDLPIGSCFELGCGVGRITRPLAHIFDKVWAADISPSNLKLCRNYMEQAGCNNVETLLFNSPTDIELIEEFDVFFSIIVLQHNPPPIQHYLLQKILQKVKPGGLCYFQTVTYNPDYSYSAEMHLSLSKHLFEQWSVHCLPMRYITGLMEKYNYSLLEVIQDGHARGMQNKFHSHTFFAKRHSSIGQISQ